MRMNLSGRATLRIGALLALPVLAAAVFVFPVMCHAAGNLPSGFVDAREVIPSLVLDMRYSGIHNFVGARIDGYNAQRCILTRKAAEALAGVQQDLSTFGLSLKVYDCYRPQKAVDHFCGWAADAADAKMKKEFYPTVDKANLFRDGYIAAKSGHSRGSTVDLTVVALPLKAQEEFAPGDRLYECYLALPKRFGDNGLDMGTGYDCFHELSHPENAQVGGQQRANRFLLRLLMEKHGFAPYDREWWHFTLKGEPFPDVYFDFPVK